MPTTPQAEPIAEPEARADDVRVWGLTVRQLHDAFWNARGVQCVRRGTAVPLQRAAELYLLIEPGHLILFDLAELSDRLLWRSAAVTRLRLMDAHADPYFERVVIDESGMVQRVERRYRPSLYGSYRVVLATTRRAAEIWMSAPDGRSGWRRIRRSVPWSRVDLWRLDAVVLDERSREDQRKLIPELVARWPEPNHAIAGIEASPRGVWHLPGEGVDPDTVRVGPLWLGSGVSGDARPCLVGPDWLADGPAGDGAAQVLPIDRIAPAERRRRAAPIAQQWYPAVKRGLDIAGAAAGLAMLAPLLGLISLLILLEDGRPIFFGHRRQGRGGRPFRCWKFRTMHRDADKIARDLEAYNICDGPQVYIQDDPRVTRLGRVLRGAHLDELPQLWNVLVGQMSLVGPRPSPDDENRFCPAWRDSRLSVRPGITGLWQLMRTREIGEDFQEWIRYDIEYVQRASLWLDLRILLATLRLVMLGRRDSAVD